MECQLVKVEKEARDLKERLAFKRPETSVINSMQALEQRVRRQSMLDTGGKINGLEATIQNFKDQHIANTEEIAEKSERIESLKKENMRLKIDLQSSYEKNEQLNIDMQELNNIKRSLEQEFTEAVDTRDSNIEQLQKQQLA